MPRTRAHTLLIIITELLIIIRYGELDNAEDAGAHGSDITWVVRPADRMAPNAACIASDLVCQLRAPPPPAPPPPQAPPPSPPAGDGGALTLALDIVAATLAGFVLIACLVFVGCAAGHFCSGHFGSGSPVPALYLAASPPHLPCISHRYRAGLKAAGGLPNTLRHSVAAESEIGAASEGAVDESEFGEAGGGGGIALSARASARAEPQPGGDEAGDSSRKGLEVGSGRGEGNPRHSVAVQNGDKRKSLLPTTAI